VFSEESFFFKIPAAVDPVQGTWLEAIRFSAGSADICYKRLRAALLELGSASTNGLPKFACEVVFSDIWGFVDSVNRFQIMLEAMPGSFWQKNGENDERVKTLKWKLEASVRDLSEVTKEVGPIRNKVQHLNNEFRNLSSPSFPIWGA